MVAPSAMMDGMVASIRAAARRPLASWNVLITSLLAKLASIKVVERRALGERP